MEKRKNITIFYIEDDKQAEKESKYREKLFKKIFGNELVDHLTIQSYGKECPICLEEIKPLEQRTVLPCNRHAMHTEPCIKSYKENFVHGKFNPEQYACPLKCLTQGDF